MGAPEQYVVVRPRLVWAGTFVVLVGMIGAGIALVGSQHLWALLGAAVIVIGALLCWKGGIAGDSHMSASLAEEEHEVAAGGTRLGASPQTHYVNPATQEVEAGTARATTDEAGTRHALPEVAPSAALGLIGLAAWIIVSPWVLRYPFTQAAESATMRQAGVAVVVTLCGLWLHQVSRNRLVGAVAAVAGLLLILSALTAGYRYAPTEVNGIVSGGAVMLLAVAAIL